MATNSPSPEDPIPANKLSVVIPCKNEEEVIAETTERVSRACEATGSQWELILIDDGSTDRTWAAILQLQKASPNIIGLRLSRNFGHQKALCAGLTYSTGDRILILDADLQDPPELLPDMMRLMDQGYHTVYGKRIYRRGETWLKRATATFFYWFINLLSDVPIPKDTGDFRLISRAVLDAFLRLPEDNRLNRLLFAWIGFPATAIEYERAERSGGKTKYNYRTMLSLAVDGITSFSLRPLKVALFFAFTMMVFAGVGSFWTLYSWWLGGTVSGWASTILSLFIIGAVQLFVLGIIGEYLGRLFLESKHRPSFIVQSVVGVEPRGQPASPKRP